MRQLLPLLILVLLTSPAQAFAHPHILRVSDMHEIDFGTLIDDLKSARVIFIGELHDNEGHHQMQLAVIQALRATGTPLAVGLEMFRRDSQKALDRWVRGEMTDGQFRVVYERNWSMWPVYKEIFYDAKRSGTPLVGLNIAREIVQQVARSGFSSLTPEQVGALEGVSCNVDPSYEKVIRRALGGHGGEGRSFVFFCEAQLLWDGIMAKNLREFLEKNPDATMVVLAGSTHAWKYGIPSQFRKASSLPFKVVLPEVFGRFDRTNLNVEEADYLWLDVGEGGWQR